MNTLSAPTVSVIIPFFNSAKYMKSCLVAIQGQTYRDFEAIFINDGSSDESAEIIERSISQDKRLRIINLPANVGPAAARNIGVQDARANYIRFMDVDDSLPPASLATLLSHSDKQNFVRGSTEVVYQGKTHLDRATENKLFGLHPFVVPMPARSKLVYGHCSTLFDKHFLLKNKIWFPEHKRNAEDTTFLTDCFFAADRVTVINEVVYQYIRHTNSLSNPANPELDYFLNTLNRWLYIKHRAINSSQPNILDDAFNNALKNYISHEQFPRVKKSLSNEDAIKLKEALENVLQAYQVPIDPYLHFFEETRAQ